MNCIDCEHCRVAVDAKMKVKKVKCDEDLWSNMHGTGEKYLKHIPRPSNPKYTTMAKRCKHFTEAIIHDWLHYWAA